MRKLFLLLCGGVNMAFAMTSASVITVGNGIRLTLYGKMHHNIN